MDLTIQELTLLGLTKTDSDRSKVTSRAEELLGEFASRTVLLATADRMKSLGYLRSPTADKLVLTEEGYAVLAKSLDNTQRLVSYLQYGQLRSSN